MPIFEYACKKCGKEFERSPGDDAGAVVPEVQSTELEKLISTPAIKSESTHGLAMKAAKKRDKKAGSERPAFSANTN